MRDYLSVARYDRTGELVKHYEDRDARPDAVEFRARSNQHLIDWVGEVRVWIDRWGTRAGVATLLLLAHALDSALTSWLPQASAMPFDAINVRGEQQVQLVFSQYIPMVAGERYRIALDGAVVTKPEISIAALQRDPAFSQGRAGVRTRRPH